MKYTEDHEWLRVEGDLVVVGITEHASTQLGDVVFVELPEVGTMVAAGGRRIREILVIGGEAHGFDAAAERIWSRRKWPRPRRSWAVSTTCASGNSKPK